MSDGRDGVGSSSAVGLMDSAGGFIGLFTFFFVGRFFLDLKGGGGAGRFIFLADFFDFLTLRFFVIVVPIHY